MKKTSVILAAVLGVSTTVTLAQAEKIKGKAKDLKRQIEAGQTNAPAKPNTPAKAR